MLLLILLVICLKENFGASNEIDDFFVQDVEMTAEPGYRTVKLKWRYHNQSQPTVFLIKYCELVWTTKYRCRKRYIPTKELSPPQNGIYEKMIYDLRMSTNYTFMIEPQLPEEESTHFRNKQSLQTSKHRAKLFNPQSITVTTKGFVAEITRCIDDWSEITVRTGPHFGGKISVENSNEEKCSVYGNRTSLQESYTLHINHELCGSRRVNDTEIQTTVIVHENKDVVTHNSRRYLVQCNLLPQIYSLQASIQVPNKKASETKHVRYPLLDWDGTDNSLSSTSNNVQDSRMDAEQHPVIHRALTDDVPLVQGDQFLFVTLIGGAAIVISLGTVLCVMFGPKRKSKSIDPEIPNTCIKRENIISTNDSFNSSDRATQGTNIPLSSLRSLT